MRPGARLNVLRAPRQERSASVGPGGEVATRPLAGEGKAQPGPQAEPAPVVTLAELDRRLARIEELLTAATASSSQRPAGAPEPHAGSDSP
jgi:hypothetical protein